jgi:hypothetical protein
MPSLAGKEANEFEREGMYTFGARHAPENSSQEPYARPVGKWHTRPYDKEGITRSASRMALNEDRVTRSEPDRFKMTPMLTQLYEGSCTAWS